MSVYERICFDRFEFRGLRGCPCICSLEILLIEDGRPVVIATELEDNPGTSITNVAEHLASNVCDRFRIDPDKLIWIETYGYPAFIAGECQRTFDLVTFSRRKPETVQWSPAVLRNHPDGWPGYFAEPNWRQMKDGDWRSLGLSPRAPVIYES